MIVMVVDKKSNSNPLTFFLVEFVEENSEAAASRFACNLGFESRDIDTAFSGVDQCERVGKKIIIV